MAKNALSEKLDAESNRRGRNIRFSDEEWQRLEAAAFTAGSTVSSFIRSAALIQAALIRRS